MNEKDTNLLDFISTMQDPQEVSKEGITASSGRRTIAIQQAQERKARAVMTRSIFSDTFSSLREFSYLP